MATTKNKLAEQIIRIVSGGSANRSSDLDSREVILFIEQERDSLVFRDYLQNRNFDDNDIHGDWITTLRNVPIKKSTGSITNLVNSTGTVTVTSANHTLNVGEYVRIVNTTNYNGYHQVTAVNGNDFTIVISNTTAADETSGRFNLPHEDYVLLPYMPLSLPSDRGIFGVYANEYSQDKYVNIGAGGNSLYKRLIESMKLSAAHNDGLFYQDGSRLYIKKYGVREYNPSSLTIQLVASAKDLDNDEILPIPAQYESDIIKSAVQMFGVMQSVQDDEVNDSIN